ncbi:MSC_0623 family F1-like ATPase-associated protein [Mycoplasma zalophidermidis]|uniref:DUF2714 domain-containing protein n=1 Tax=Mycoplasma zalophidermidis TaxID=398174 RepID=A0ABS6DQP8_9MOLU|nr:DUF2714 domain-containing protein [Mycoplasma zalophidermidis]MBU4689452.1 DUF2714 domain-containing protein [Mycoplasma zalophidermidis]MBU4693330.1 DUF2714 domain-containing protein [Mycoplasma zalophidermidis]MCR8966372.1 DUF2714 domain-containing protein [Mycoplasma zalophidermidis]
MKNNSLLKKKIKSMKLQNELSLINLYDSYNSLIKDPEFISFEQLNASVLLSKGMGFESPSFTKFNNKLKEAIAKKHDIIFRNFIISFNIDLKFSQNILVPIIKNEISSSVICTNLSSSNDPNLDDYLCSLNDKIDSLLKTKSYIEIMPGTVLFNSTESNTLKLLFGPEVLSLIKD